MNGGCGRRERGALDDFADSEGRVGQRPDHRLRLRLRQQSSLAVGVKFTSVRIEVGSGGKHAAIQADQARVERGLGIARRGQRGNWDAIGGGHEGHSLALTLHDEPQGRGLHAAGGQAAANFLPEDGGNEVADQPVEDAARFLRLDQALIDLTGCASALR